MGPSTANLRLCLQWGMCALLLASTLVSMTSAAVPVWDEPGGRPFVASRDYSSSADGLPGAGRAVGLDSGVPQEGSGAVSAKRSAREGTAGSHEASLELLAEAASKDNFATVGTSRAADIHATHVEDNFASAKTSGASNEASSFLDDNFGVARYNGGTFSSDDASISNNGAASASARMSSDDSDEVLASAAGEEGSGVAARAALPPRKLRPFWAFQGSTALPVHSWEDLKLHRLKWFQRAQRQASATLSWVLQLPGSVKQGRIGGGGGENAGSTVPDEEANKYFSVEKADAGGLIESAVSTVPNEELNTYFFSVGKAGAGAGAGGHEKSAGAGASGGALPVGRGAQAAKSWGVYMEEVSN